VVTGLVVAVGGLDPWGGAGVLRDWKTAVDLGAQAVVVGTAWTRQDSGAVQGIEPRLPDLVAAALAQALAASPATTAVKIGMLANPAIAAAVTAVLGGWSGPVVFDPVVRATSGGGLFDGRPQDLADLLARATLVTPNLAEAAWLTGAPVTSTTEAQDAGLLLCQRGVQAVLVKGGHLEGAAVDVLCTGTRVRTFHADRLPGPSPRGTGCALATALAVNLARGLALDEAVGQAKSWLKSRIAAAVTVGNERYLS
jgi:hydroxymethylpyrimidine kinase/phosphomethylpyrimidine kinase